jgi:NAD(P)-dependent dehydrogenase (short-subunit alcohol dehydrogenase family)
MELIGMARGLASEFASHNIRVNVVFAGQIVTRRDNPEWYQGHLLSAAGVPLGRQGSVDEIAAICVFLVSEGPRLHHRPDNPRQSRRATITDCGRASVHRLPRVGNRGLLHARFQFCDERRPGESSTGKMVFIYR